MDRRRFVKSIGGGFALVGACKTHSSEQGIVMPDSSQTVPALFLAHGAPFLVDDPVWSSQLRQWAQNLPKPRAILVFSAHWEKQPITLASTNTRELIYDFFGFPERYYGLRYPAPGAPDLARRVGELLKNFNTVKRDENRGLDHGAWVPLYAMYPEANVPVLQVSLPSFEPQKLFELGRALAPLRQEGVLLIGSGHLTHNLRRADFGPNAQTPTWAADFDAWTTEKLVKKDLDALFNYRTLAPGVHESLPTHEHYVPLFVTLGATLSQSENVQFPITGWLAGSLTKRSLQVG